MSINFKTLARVPVILRQVRRISEEKTFDTSKTFTAKSIQEALFDIEKYIDPKVIEYLREFEKNDPEGLRRTLKRYAQNMNRDFDDPREAEYYYWRMLLPHQQATILSKEFYQKEYRNRVDSVDFHAQDSDSGQGADSSGEESGEYFAYSPEGYSGNLSAMGVFANLSAPTNPEELTEIDDFFTKLFQSPLLNRYDKIVLCVYLLLGSGPGMRTRRGSDPNGLDLEALMSQPPEEYYDVIEQINKLLKFGLDPEDINKEKILFGYKKEGGENAPHIKGLMGKKPADAANVNIQNALKKLAGTDDLEQIKMDLLGNHTTYMGNVAWKNTSESKDISEADDKVDIAALVAKYISGQVVTGEELMTVLTYAAQANISKGTELSKSFSSKDPAVVAKEYFDLEANGNERDSLIVQSMVLAPAIEDKVNSDINIPQAMMELAKAAD